MDFEKAQEYYQWVKKTWSTQDDATKHQMLVQLKEIYHHLTPGERGCDFPLMMASRAGNWRAG